MLNLVSKKTFKSALLAGTAAAAAMSAFAVPAVAADGDTVEKVTVTGTRLKKRDYNTISPVTTIGSQTFELTATTSVEALLNDLPQLVPGNTFTSNNAGGEDFATLDLRGIGPSRTLILVNGRRLPASSTTGVTDINTIPAGLIDRVEVVTGGASAVYGSDAMAGVVNFILKKDFEGMEFTMSAGQGERSLGDTRDFQALIGGNFAGGNGNITMYAEYFSREGVLQGEQAFSRNSGSYCYHYTGGQADYGSKPIDTNAEAIACRAGGGFVGSSGSGTPPWGWITNSSAGRGPDGFFGTADDTGNPFGGLPSSGAVGLDGILGTADDTAVYTTNAGTLNTLLPGQFAAANTDCNPATAGAIVRGNGNLSFNDAGAVTPRFTGAACAISDRTGGSSRYNFAPDNYIILPAERYNVSIFGHYDLEKDLTLNFGAIYSDSFTKVQLAPTPATGISVQYTDALDTYLAAFHPDLKTALNSRPLPYADFVMDRRTTELGTRNGFNENSNLNLFASLEGKIDDNWSYEISASFADVDFVSKLENSANKTGLQQGAARCNTKVAGADGIYGTLDDVDVPLGPMALPGCVGTDLFGTNTINRGPDGILGNIDDVAGVNFLKVNTWSRTQVEESIVSGFLSGDLWDLTGAGNLGVVGGFEYRSSKASFEVDNEQRTGNIFGFNALQDQRGTIDVYEGYTEMSLPIVKDQPFMYYLGAEAGYRISDYTNVGVVHTYKYGGEYSPFQWLKFRGVYNKATRAPSVFEGFQNGDQGFANFTDPCRDANGNGVPDNTAVTLAECTANVNVNNRIPGGIYAGFIANNTQVQALSFGNTSLAPEVAETTTLGVVLQTGNDWFGLGNIRASVDLYDIDVDKYITTLGTTFFLNDCYVTNTASSCNRIIRDPNTGQITSVNTTRSNTGHLATDGVDIQVDYRLDLADIGLAGVLNINELYSILDTFAFDSDSSDANGPGNLAGGVSSGIGGAFPDFKSVLSGTYSLEDWTVFTRWTYSPSMVSLNFPGIPPVSPAASYVDMAVRYNVSDWMSVTLTVNNVADEETPQTLDGALFGQGNTDPQVYDVLGRTWNLSVKTKM
ncbi:MAG: TonB-dependent receptor [Micropepsaceae bacterium]